MEICLKCGETFDTPETRTETVDIVDGVAVKETQSYSPCCRAAHKEAERCVVCGEWRIHDTLTSGVCRACLDGCRYNCRLCYEIAENAEDETAVNINSFLASVFAISEINKILLDYIGEHVPSVDCGEYIGEDTDWFAEMLAQRKEVDR